MKCQGGGLQRCDTTKNLPTDAEQIVPATSFRNVYLRTDELHEASLGFRNRLAAFASKHIGQGIQVEALEPVEISTGASTE